MEKKKIPLVIAYDFDGTLSPGNMQEYDFIPELGIPPEEFWKEASEFAKEQNADTILAYMQLMLEKAKTKKVSVRKEKFQELGATIPFFSGVEEWFNRINIYGKTHGVEVKHFIISSGLREMIEGTKIAHNFEKIYASGFMYDENDVAYWPALAVNYTTKTQYIFRINKDCLDVYDNSEINKYVPESERPVPFTSIVFIGDGETDIPCMQLVKALGGHSIIVYDEDKHGADETAKQMKEYGRTNISAPANYEEDSPMDTAVKAIIDKLVAQNKIYSA